MRKLGAILVLWALWPALAMAQSDKSVSELVELAVGALQSMSYEARIRAMRDGTDEQEQVAHVYHVVPDLFHVEPLQRDSHGQWQSQGYYYIENAEELVRVNLVDGQVFSIEEMPERAFCINDALIRKFLRDLANHKGTESLSGQVGSIPVFVLRQKVSPEKPYTITVGLDQRNYFPVFVLVNDATEKARVYFEMEAIEYSAPGNPEQLFKVPEVREGLASKAPRPNQLPSTVLQNQAFGEESMEVSVQRSSSSVTPAGPLVDQLQVPLWPAWLPDGYQIEGLRLLDYRTENKQGSVMAMVYQFEIYGPEPKDLLSVFQTRSEDIDLSLNNKASGRDFVINQQDGWIVAVFGDLPLKTLTRVAYSLCEDEAKMSQLLAVTKARDQIIQEVLDVQY